MSSGSGKRISKLPERSDVRAGSCLTAGCTMKRNRLSILQAIPTFAFLKEQIGTRYFEDLIQKWILDESPRIYVIVKTGERKNRADGPELDENCRRIKAGLSPDEVEKLARDTAELIVYQESEDAREDMERFRCLDGKIFPEIAPICNEERVCGGIPMVYHNVGDKRYWICDAVVRSVRSSGRETSVCAGILQAVPGIIDTTHYEYRELFIEINVHTGGIGTSLELYPM